MVLHLPRQFHEDDVGIDAEDLIAKLLFESVHNGEDNDQCRNPQEYACNRNNAVDGYKCLLPLGPEVSEAYE